MSIYGLLAWLTTLLSVVAYFFNIKKKKICFLIWEVSTVIIVYNFLWGKPDKMVYWATATLFAFYGVMNILGYFQWKREEENGRLHDKGQRETQGVCDGCKTGH